MKNILEEYKPVRSLVNSLDVYQSRYICPLPIRTCLMFTINMQACLEVVSLEVGSVGWLELQLVITSVLYLVGNLRHFPSYSLWSTPWLMQFLRLPFADGRVEQPNHIIIYKWLAVNFLIVKLLLEAVLLTRVFPHSSKCVC